MSTVAGQKIRKHRLLKGWSRAQLAVRAKVSHETVCEWERGRQEPLFTNGLRLAQVLEVPPEALLEDDPREDQAVAEMPGAPARSRPDRSAPPRREARR